MHRTENLPQFSYSREFSGLVVPKGVQTLGPILLSTSLIPVILSPTSHAGLLACWGKGRVAIEQVAGNHLGELFSSLRMGSLQY